MIAQPDGPPCNCGNRGCLEAIASGTALARRAREEISAGRHSFIAELAEPHGVTAEAVVVAARAGDELAVELLREAGRWLGLGVIGLVHLFNPQVVIIGGGVTGAGELLMEPLRDEVFSGVMPVFREDLKIVLPDLGPDVGLYGAVALARSVIGETPENG